MVAGIYQDPDGQHMWLMDRCGGNNCAGVDVDPILKLDLQGNLVTSFGKGLFGWPHGFFVDHEGNMWVTEGSPVGEARGGAGFKLGRGHQVFKLSPEGKVLVTLGEANVPGDDKAHFNGPSHVLVAPNGEIWVTDGHRGGNNRLVKFSADGTYIMQVGGGVEAATAERGLFNDPHHLAMDSRGRLFVSDRGNNRILFSPCACALSNLRTSCSDDERSIERTRVFADGNGPPDILIVVRHRLVVLLEQVLAVIVAGVPKHARSNLGRRAAG